MSLRLLHLHLNRHLALPLTRRSLSSAAPPLSSKLSKRLQALREAKQDAPAPAASSLKRRRRRGKTVGGEAVAKVEKEAAKEGVKGRRRKVKKTKAAEKKEGGEIGEDASSAAAAAASTWGADSLPSGLEYTRDLPPHLKSLPTSSSSSTSSPHSSTRARSRSSPPDWRPHHTAQHATLHPYRSAPIEPVMPAEAQPPIPRLRPPLTRTLFQPSHPLWLRCPRTGVYNFPPSLEEIVKPEEFDFGRLPPYMTSSRDRDLANLARRESLRYVGSTSSMTAVLAHIYFLISGWREVSTASLSSAFKDESTMFNASSRLPASILLRLLDPPTPTDPSSSTTTDAPAASSSSSSSSSSPDTPTPPSSETPTPNPTNPASPPTPAQPLYAIDADKSHDPSAEDNILLYLGTQMEKQLTLPEREFNRLLRSSALTPEVEERKREREAYHYARSNSILMRSQLDCEDERLPRKTFDIKTRACVAVRQDRLNYEEGGGYMIKQSQGLLESFEREYYDMIRGAFLKYGLQARIGHMDGIFVAYHNTARIFGFQYVPLEEMDARVYGTSEMAEQAFRHSVAILERVLDEASGMFPGETLRMTFETRTNHSNMTVYVQPDRTSSASSSEAEAEADDEEGPIRQIDVSVKSRLNGDPVSGPIDFESHPDWREGPHEDAVGPVLWELEYTLNTSAPEEAFLVRRNLHGTRKRQTALGSIALPDGLTPTDIARRRAAMRSWRPSSTSPDSDPEAVQEGAAEEEDAEVGLGVRYMPPSRHVQELRRLSREGERMRKMLEEKWGGRKVVWREVDEGEGEGVEEDRVSEEDMRAER